MKELIEKELERYQKQLEALENDDNYNNYEDKRVILRAFYKRQIDNFKKMLSYEKKSNKS